MKQNHSWWIGAVLIAVALLAGCGSGDDDADAPGGDVAVSADEAPAPTAATETAEDAPPAEEEPTTVLRDMAAPISEGSVYDPEAEPLLVPGSPFEPGTYRNAALGTEISFTTTERLHTQPNFGGLFVVTDLASRAPDDRDLVFMRVGSFADPVAPNAPIEDGTLWPSDDFRGWLASLHDGVLATDPVETTVNGLPAVRVDVELSDDIDCGWLPGFCVGFIENNGHEVKAFNKGASYRVWVVEQRDEDPLAIIMGIARDADAGWFERAEAVLDTIAFGDIEPNPVQPLIAGSNRLRTLGGVEVTLPDNLNELTNGRPRIFQPWGGRGFWWVPVTESPGAVYFSDRPHDFEGNPLASSDEVVDLLTAGGAELTELDGVTIDGVDARVFDVTSSDVGAILLKFSPLDLNQDFFGWDAPAAGRIWLIEHPERGLMMISTHAFDRVDEMLPVVNELGDAIVESLVFAVAG